MLARYLLREVSGPFVLGVLVFIGLITTDLLSSLSGIFLDQGTPFTSVLKMVFYRLPYTLGLALPLGLVFAILIALSRWNRDSELKAINAAGIAPISLMPALLTLGIAVGLAVFANAAWLRPSAELAYEKLLYEIYYGQSPSGVLSNQSYTPQNLGLYYAARIYPEEAGARLVGIRVINPQGQIFSAATGRWQGSQWILENAYWVEPDSQVKQRANLALPFSGQFVRRLTTYEGLSLSELRELARSEREAGFPLQRRYADAAGALVLCWLALVIGLSLRHTGWAFAATVALIASYYALWALSAQLNNYAVLGPASAWLPVLVFGIASLVGSWRLR